MSDQVKRYHAHQIPESGLAGLWIHAGDFNQKMNQAKERESALHAEAEALRAENVRLRQAMQRLVTKHCAAATKNNATYAELEQYLSAGIAQLEGQRDKLAGELAAIKGQEPVAFYWQDIGYPEPRKHGPYFGWPSESALRNVDGGAIPVPLYALPAAPEGGEV